MQFRFIVLVLTAFLFPQFVVYGANADELRSQIEEKNAEIEDLKKDILKFEKVVAETSKEADSLEKQVNSISATISKLSSEVNFTQRKIEATELSIEELTLQIADKNSSIDRFKKTLAEIIRNINELESQSLVEIMLASASLSGFFSDIDYIENLNSDMQLKLAELRLAKSDLEDEKNKNEELRSELGILRKEFTERQSIEENARIQKNNLLEDTHNKEAQYKKLLADRVARKEALENEIRAVEEELRIVIDPDSLPPARSGVIDFPLPDISLSSCYSGGALSKNCVTQFFGNTSFATKNPQIYKAGTGHPGIDFRASIGTPVTASADGVVRSTGNTDLQCRYASYGKWILVDHFNNLSTLYAHLSHTSVSSGQEVRRGNRIGYSGNTGATTGPHLHFEVLATKAVRVTSLIKQPGAAYFESKNACPGTSLHLPLVPPNGRLNPLSYL